MESKNLANIIRSTIASVAALASVAACTATTGTSPQNGPQLTQTQQRSANLNYAVGQLSEGSADLSLAKFVANSYDGASVQDKPKLAVALNTFLVNKNPDTCAAVESAMINGGFTNYGSSSDTGKKNVNGKEVTVYDSRCAPWNDVWKGVQSAIKPSDAQVVELAREAQRGEAYRPIFMRQASKNPDNKSASYWWTPASFAQVKQVFLASIPNSDDKTPLNTRHTISELTTNRDAAGNNKGHGRYLPESPYLQLANFGRNSGAPNTQNTTYGPVPVTPVQQLPAPTAPVR